MVEADFTLPLFMQVDAARYEDGSACMVVSLIDNSGELLLSIGEGESVRGLDESQTWDERFKDALSTLGARLLAEFALHLQDEGMRASESTQVASGVLNPDCIVLAATHPSVGL